jgi:4-hydroxy-tetrahydrodipicolinate synthase
MKELLELRGIVTVLNTPFTADDTVDVPGLCRNVELAIEAGVAGFLVPAMASEVGKLSWAERDAIVRAVVNTVAGRATVIGGASARTGDERTHLARKLTELGCHGVLVSILYENDAQYIEDVQSVADTNPGFLVLQDWDPTGYGLPLPLIVRLFEEVEAFRCLKVETASAGSKYTEVLEATGGRLHTSGGWGDLQMIEALDRGVHAIMPTGMHRIYTAIYELYRLGNRSGARQVFDDLVPVLAFSNQHLDISIHFFKRLLHAQGVYATARVRQPILPFDRFHERVADELIDRAMRLERELRLKPM